MKNYLVLALLAVFTWTAPLSAVRPEYGFFCTVEEQEIYGPTESECEKTSVSWDNEGEHSRRIFLQDEDSSAIVLELPGVYLVNFIVNAKNEELSTLCENVQVQEPFRFSLTLNDDVIPGSIYSANGHVVEDGSVTGSQQIVGQVVFFSENSDAVLRLVNDSDCDNCIELVRIEGCCDSESTTASIFVQRLYKSSQN